MMFWLCPSDVIPVGGFLYLNTVDYLSILSVLSRLLSLQCFERLNIMCRFIFL